MWAPGGPPGPAGWDRRRVGARLRAALAGLQELQGLRMAQQARVRGALALQPPPGPRARAQELRLGKALAALQEQLSRLRQQDIGLKTHLDQLDQQISELQLDVCRSSGEALDSDSRPSSGFYELSDVGSCSLSTSCASVCSDRLSPSLGSLLPMFQSPTARPGMGDWRPRSADETTVPAWRPWPTEEGGGPLDSKEDIVQPRGMSRPRPVSTGDLEHILPADGLQGDSTETTPASLLGPGTDRPSHVLDPKYQRDLVSRGGREVYAYPSPLHAVALQSPLFALPRETSQLNSLSSPKKPLSGPRDLNRSQAGPVLESGSPGAYIDRLLSLRNRGSPLRGTAGDLGPPGCEASPSPQRTGSQRWESRGQPEQPACAPERGDAGGTAQSRATPGDHQGQQGPAPLLHPSSPPEAGPKPRGFYACVEDTVGHSPCPQPQEPHSDGSQSTLSPPGSIGPRSPLLDPGHLVYPPCPARDASPARLQPGHPKTKAVKLRRRASDKGLRPGGQPPPLPERHRGVHAAPRLPLEWEASPRRQTGGLRARPALAREAPGRSCSESTLYPVPLVVPLVLARQESYRASSQALFPREPAPLGTAARRKQRRWRSSVEISGRARPAGCPEPSPGPPRPVARRAAGAWARPALARQDACIRSESEPSKRSAECTSLFHSTIAETSEEDASDHTVNCFGDRESSSSDPEGPARRGEPAWPRATGARPPLPPVPKLCRIKASRALKKKIRTFQPAALKVMTMV